VPPAGAAVGWTGDLRHALRRMRQAPGFTLVAVLTLALGIGGTSAIFTVVKAVLLDPLPYREPARLVLLWNELRAQNAKRAPGSAFELAELRRRAASFEGIAGIWAGNGTLLGEGDPELLKLGYVTGNFFELLGTPPLLGRLPASEGAGEPPRLVLGHGLWQRRFGGDPDVVGRAVRMDGYSVTVAAVMPPGFRMVFPPDAQVPVETQAWMPFPWDIAQAPRDLHYLRFVARLRPGVSVAQAHEEVDAIGRRLAGEFVELEGLALQAVPMHGDAVREIRPALVALFAGVGLVLLIACVNVANLLLARAGARRREMAVRAALGASRGRLVRQLFLENLLLAAIGGALGLLLGAWSLDRLSALAPSGVLPPAPLSLDAEVLVFALLTTFACALVVGVSPALSASRVDLATALSTAVAGAGPTPGRRARAALVVAEVALGFVLLVGAGLMIRTFVAVQSVDPGFRADGALSFELNLPGPRYPGDARRLALVAELERRLAALPGVTAAGAVSHLPFDDYPNWYSPFRPEGAPEDGGFIADHRAATPGYLAAAGARLIRGRGFEPLDTRPVVIVDERVAAEAWPGADPIGKVLQVERWSEGEFVPERAEVIGVVRPLAQQRLTSHARGQIYLPYARSARPHVSFVVHAAGDPLALAGPARAAVASLDGELAVAKLRPLAFYLERATRPARFTMVLASLFGGLALALAGIGIYGVVATSVSQRRREFAVRMALGAETSDVTRQVLREGLALALAGLLLGVAGAAALAQLLRALLFGVGALDPASYAAAAVVLPLCALAASVLPARRAARESPMAVLRAD
jgi:predicted permease